MRYRIQTYAPVHLEGILVPVKDDTDGNMKVWQEEKL